MATFDAGRHRIILRSQGWHEESVVGATAPYPGHILSKASDGTVVPHNVAGGGGPLVIAKEDGLLGGVITTQYLTGGICSEQYLSKGDRVLLRLAAVLTAVGSKLMSNGDGTLTLWTGYSKVYEIVAPSTVITSTNVETTFSNGSYAFPANTMAVGDQIVIRGKVVQVAENGTDTTRIRLYVGATTLVDSTALQLAAADVVEFTANLTIRTIGVSGTFVVDGTMTYTVSGTNTTKSVTVNSTVIDTTAIQTVAVKALQSSSSAGNQTRLDEFQIDQNRAGGNNALFEADEVIDNTGGLHPFCIALAI